MNKRIQVGIIGGAGYTGGELLRLLLHHPAASIRFVHSRSNAGKPVHAIHQDLLGETDLQFSSETGNDIDVLFLCLGHGESAKFLAGNQFPEMVRIIDLANDFRLKKNAVLGNRRFVYGLPELNRDAIRSAQNIANPGCFATCIQLGLLPLAKAGYLGPVYCTGITGSTGAGQNLTATSHFSWRINNIQAYKTLTHQHVPEIMQSLHQLQDSYPEINADKSPMLNFVPWRGDFSRGIFVSSQLAVEQPAEKLIRLFENFYEDHPFCTISQDALFLKQVVNTNKCVIQLEKVGSLLVIHSVIDNLLKGASGQAVQNMNLMFGLDEGTGLQLKANYF